MLTCLCKLDAQEPDLSEAVLHGQLFLTFHISPYLDSHLSPYSGHIISWRPLYLIFI